MGYEVSMGNRMLNKFAKDDNHVIRLAFRYDFVMHYLITGVLSRSSEDKSSTF